LKIAEKSQPQAGGIFPQAPMLPVKQELEQRIMGQGPLKTNNECLPAGYPFTLFVPMRPPQVAIERGLCPPLPMTPALTTVQASKHLIKAIALKPRAIVRLKPEKIPIQIGLSPPCLTLLKSAPNLAPDRLQAGSHPSVIHPVGVNARRSTFLHELFKGLSSKQIPPGCSGQVAE
jgi:hypothetical protein